MKKKVIILIAVALSLFSLLFIGVNNQKEIITNLDSIKLYDDDNGKSNFDLSIKEYDIETPTDLFEFFSLDADTSGMTFTLKNDIDMKSVQVRALNSFSGTFDGNNKTISNLSYTKVTSGDTYSFFNELKPNAVVKNLKIDGITTRQSLFQYDVNKDSYCEFIHKMDAGSMLYNCEFTNIYLGCEKQNGNLIAYNYKSSSIVGECSGLISNCKISSPYDYPETYGQNNYIYGLEFAAGFVSKALENSFIERCDVFGACISGLENIGGICAKGNGSYLTSNLVRGCELYTIPQDELFSSFKQDIIDLNLYTTSSEKFFGGVIGNSINTIIVNNIFYNQSNRNLYSLDEGEKATLTATAGDVYFGGIVGKSNNSSIDFNIFSGSMQVLYSSGVVSINSLSNYIIGGEIEDCKHYNFIYRGIDEKDNQYFVDLSNETDSTRTWENDNDKVYSVSPVSSQSFNGTALSCTIGKIIGSIDYDGTSLFDELISYGYKAYKPIYEAGIKFTFNDYSNKAIVADLSNLTGQDYYYDLINCAELFKLVKENDGSYEEVNLYNRIINLNDNKYALEYSMPYDSEEEYYLVYYDAAAKNSSGYLDTFDQYEVLNGGYYFLCDMSGRSYLNELVGEKLEFVPVNNVSRLVSGDEKIVDSSHHKYGDNIIRIVNRMWISGNYLVDYTKSEKYSFEIESGYTLNLSYTRYDSTNESFSEDIVNDNNIENIEFESIGKTIGNEVFTVYYDYSFVAGKITGMVQLNDVYKNDSNMELIDINGNLYTGSAITLDYSSDQNYTISINNPTINLSNYYVRFSYKEEDVTKYILLGSVNTFKDFLTEEYLYDDLATFYIVLLRVTYETPDFQTLTTDKEDAYYFYRMYSSGNTTFYFNKANSIGDEETCDYGYPFNPIQNYDLDDDKTIEAEIAGWGDLSGKFNYDIENEKFYLCVNENIHNGFSSREEPFGIGFSFSLMERKYKIYQAWDECFKRSMNSSLYEEFDQAVVESYFYGPYNSSKDSFYYTESNRDSIPKLGDKATYYYVENGDISSDTYDCMIREIHYYSDSAHNNEITDISNVTCDLYIIYSLAVSFNSNLNFDYTYKHLDISVKYNDESISLDNVEIVYSEQCSSYEAIDSIVQLNDIETNISHDVIIPKTYKDCYMWILVYSDASKVTLSKTLFVGSQNDIRNGELNFYQLVVSTNDDVDAEGYRYDLKVGNDIVSTGYLNKDNSIQYDCLNDKYYTLSFDCPRGYKITADTLESSSDSEFEICLEEESLNSVVTKEIIFYQIYYEWDSGLVYTLHVDGIDPIETPKIDQDFFNAGLASATIDALKHKGLVYTVEDSSIGVMWVESSIEYFKYGDDTYAGLLIHVHYETPEGRTLSGMPTPDYCQNFTIRFSIVLQEESGYRRTYKTVTVPETLKYNGEDINTYGNIKLSASRNHYVETSYLEYCNISGTGVYTISYYACTDSNASYRDVYPFVLVEDNNGIYLCEDFDDSLEVYKYTFTCTSLISSKNPGINLMLGNGNTELVEIYDAMYLSSSWRYDINLDFTSQGYHVIIDVDGNKYHNTCNGNVTENLNFNLSEEYIDYYIYYSWNIESTVFFDDEFFTPVLNQEYLLNLTSEELSKYHLQFTVEESNLVYLTEVGDMLKIMPNDSSEYVDALVIRMNYSTDASQSEGSIILSPVTYNIYVTITLALPDGMEAEYNYHTANVVNVLVDDEPIDYSFKMSRYMNDFTATDEYACNLSSDKEHLYYYNGNDLAFIYLFNNGQAIGLCNVINSNIDVSFYSLTINCNTTSELDFLPEGSTYYYQYDVKINGKGYYGAAGQTYVYYLKNTDNAAITFPYYGPAGYEYKYKGDYELDGNVFYVDNVSEPINFIVDFEYTPSTFIVYYYLTKDELLADQSIGGLNSGTVDNSNYDFVKYTTNYNNFPLVNDGYRLVGYYIYNEDGEDILITPETQVLARNVLVYGVWAEAGKGSLELYFYDKNHSLIEYDQEDIRESISVYYVDSDGNKIELTKLDNTANTINSLEYKLNVVKTMDNGYFYRVYFYYYDLDITDGDLIVYIKFPLDTEYSYLCSLKNLTDYQQFKYQRVDVTYSNYDSNDYEDHVLSISGCGWYSFEDSVTLTIDIEEGYYAYFSSTDLSRILNIYNSKTIYISSIAGLYNDYGSLDIDLTIARKLYYIYYYIDGELMHTDSYYSGDSVSMWEVSDSQLNGLRVTSWDEVIDVMPASNITVYANVIYGNTKVLDIDFDSIVTDGMFFIADNKNEITSRTIITEAVILGNNRIEVTYKDNKGFLWMVDPVTNSLRYLDVNLDDDSLNSIKLIKYTIPSNVEHINVSNLGYHLYNCIVGFEVSPDSGYSYKTNEKMVGNIILGPNAKKDYVLDLTEIKNKYKVYYYIKDEKVHTDEFEFEEKIIPWEYDNSYSSEFNFDSWSSIEYEYMPAFDIKVFGQESKDYVLYTLPKVDRIHENDTLGTAVFSGGLIKVGNMVVQGEYRFEDSNMVVKQSDSATTLFKVIFTPDDLSMIPYEFYMTVIVCKPKYNLPLDEIELISRTSNSLFVHINEKYEYSFNGGSFIQGGDVRFTGLSEDSIYTFTYRYKEDDQYCASSAYTMKFRTYSYDEMIYMNSQSAGLSLIESFEKYFDNKTVQMYLSRFKKTTLFTCEYNLANMSGAEAKAYVEYISLVLEILSEIEQARVPIANLDADRIKNYANKRVSEMADLAFEQNVNVKSLERYKNYVVDVLKVSDNIVYTYGITKSDLNKTININLTSADLIPKLDILNQTDFVIDKVDELLDYDYQNYDQINLVVYKDNYIKDTVDLMKKTESSLHHTDTAMVTQNISNCVSKLQGLTYMDYTFNREEYDAIFFKAAEAAVVAHMQVIVLYRLDDMYSIKSLALVDLSKRLMLKNVYLGLVEEYSNFDNFFELYKEMIESGTDMTYDDCIEAFSNTLDTRLTLPVNSSLSSTEVVIIFLFGSALFLVLCVIVIKFFINRRGYNAKAREQ